MYPRNNATPPEIALGEIVLKADGTQQTSGASARVKIGTGSWGAAAGTLACDATSGIWTYAPTQAETDATYFVVAAYKSACTSVSQTIITTGSATAGRALLSAETHTGAVIPTVSAVTGLTAANLDVAVSTRMATYTQPTGFLAATFPSGTIANTTNISTVATVAGTVGGIAGITFPTNFASLGINASGHITRAVLVDTATALTTNNDKTGYSLANNAVNSNTFQSTFSLSAQNLTNAPTGTSGGGSGDASQSTLLQVLKVVQANSDNG